jgi:hypothetical protein
MVAVTKKLPRYPIYVPSKGRYDTCYTAKFFLEEGIPFYLVVEPSEEKSYRANFPDANFLVLPEDNFRLLGARNWIRQHSEKAGFKRHWQFDDNIRSFMRLHKGYRIYCDGNIAIRVCEDFTDRYENIGISGFNYSTFVIADGKGKIPPFYLNCHVYSGSLINNEMPYTWRLLYNDDTDICLQALVGGMCTVALNTFMIQKMATMTVKGGNTQDLYQGDGRLRMAKALERQWPYLVETKRRFKRPQHVVKGQWRYFDNKLIRRKDVDWENLEADNYGLELVQVKDEIKSKDLRKLVADNGDKG